MCDGVTLPRTPGSYANCTPMPDPDYIQHPDVYAEFLKGLKDDDRDILVAGIIGNPTPFDVILNEDGEPELDYSCTTSGGFAGAVPGVRFQHFLDQFPGRSVFSSICN